MRRRPGPPGSTAGRVLIRGLWQTVNIGDVANVVGVLRAFERSWPAAELVLWPLALGDRERAMLHRRCPAVAIVEGRVDAGGSPSTRALADEFALADVLVHGPAPELAAEADVRAWRRLTGRPYGFFGITVDPLWRSSAGTLAELRAAVSRRPAGDLGGHHKELLDGAAFVFCRDTVSLAYLRAQGVAAKILEFGPDATFAFDLHDQAFAERMLRHHDLVDRAFICVVPRLRYSPYHRIHGFEPSVEDLRRDAVNAAHVDHDLGALRDMIVGWVRGTGQMALACPEMTYQLDLCRRELVDKLPADVARRVACVPDFWSPAQAAAVYARAFAVVSQECHSPLLSVAAGRPAIYVRNPTDSVKGQMYPDLGLGEDLLEVTETTGDQLLRTLLAGQANEREAVARAERGRDAALARLSDMVAAAAAAATTGRESETAGDQRLDAGEDVR